MLTFRNGIHSVLRSLMLISIQLTLWSALELRAESGPPASVQRSASDFLIPQPQSVNELTTEPGFMLDDSAVVVAPASWSFTARLIANEWRVRLVSSDEPAAATRGRKVLRFTTMALPGEPVGSYRLQVRRDQITIIAADGEGAANATHTLRQLVLTERVLRQTKAKRAITIPALDIDDRPRFAWRGLMLDLSGHFFGVKSIKQIIDNMAAYKLNRLHLHLADNFGWRLDVPGYPKLRTVGARGDFSRPHGKARFFSAEELRDVVRYASARNIEVIPEIDMPGHSAALARAYPELSDGHQTLNPASPATYKFVDTVLGHLATIFPSRYIHIGGDEVRETRWEKMPDVVAMARSLSPNADTPNFLAVESEFTRRVERLVAKHGRVAIGWDEVTHAGLPTNAVVQWWRKDKPNSLRAALNAGHSIVLSPADRLYLDYPAGLGEPGAPWEGNDGGPMSVEKIISWTPITSDIPAEQARQVMGIEAPLWTAFVRSQSFLEFMLYPRLAAVAEVAWRTKVPGDSAEFVGRLAPHISRWSASGVNVRTRPEDAYRYMVH